MGEARRDPGVSNKRLNQLYMAGTASAMAA
jgi:hypothetical protein